MGQRYLMVEGATPKREATVLATSWHERMYTALRFLFPFRRTSNPRRLLTDRTSYRLNLSVGGDLASLSVQGCRRSALTPAPTASRPLASRQEPSTEAVETPLS